MSKQDKINNFDPSGVGQTDNQIFGLPFDKDESDIILLPVPWDVTTSYNPGTSAAPGAVLEASFQVDLYDLQFIDVWRSGIYIDLVDVNIQEKNISLRQHAEHIIEQLEAGKSTDELQQELAPINQASEQLNDWVYSQSKQYVAAGKKVGLLGGDHSTPLGHIKAIAEHYGPISILQIDAHLDLRPAYEGFTYSHASIMYNALQETDVAKLVSVGIRDCGQNEIDYVNTHAEQVKVFFDSYIKQQLYEGVHWRTICQQVIEALDDKVYISFDIDGLEPGLCPNTGTPVPGGILFEQVNYLLVLLKHSGKQIVGFDLCEVGNAEWDANVGARILYKLCGMLA